MSTVSVTFFGSPLFRWNGGPLINTQLQLGGWYAEKALKRFSAFTWLAGRLDSESTESLAEEKPLKTIKIPPVPCSHPNH
jgi:hypothetical protein